MAALTSEAVILRTWPIHEADLIVSFFSREHGRIKGVAKAALKSRKRFGGALEPMTVVRAWFAERPRQELVRLDQLEIIRSPLSAPVDHVRLTVLSFFAELLDQALPEHDPHETIFRLLISVLEQTTVEHPWMALTYFVLFPHPHLTPFDPRYWFLMQAGMICGYLTSFPMNAFLIRRGLKEAM